jgi:hypothetical protein
MYSFRRFALLLALATMALPAVQAQSSSSNPPTQDQAQPGPTPQQLTVQARIRARREQRRANAIREAYSHTYEAYTGMGYLRFVPGPSQQRVTLYAWDAGVTRFYNERLGITVDGRGYYGTAFVGLNPYGITRPAISQYAALAGPTYRFYLQPKYSVSGRVMGGFAHGNFSGDTNGLGAKTLGLYPDANTFAASASLTGEYNLTPTVGFRLSPEYYATGFGSTTQNSLGFTGGIVYRFGKK